MAVYAGSAMSLSWIWSGGTASLQAKFRTFAWKPTLDFIDGSGGSDTFEVLVPGIGRGSDITYTAVMQAGAAGTALLGAVAKRNEGTLIFGPEGTAAGAPKFTIPAISSGPGLDQAYDDVPILTINFRQNAAESVGAF